LFFADLCGFAAFFEVFLEPPRMALRSPPPVPKTCPQAVAATGDTDYYGELTRERHAGTVTTSPDAECPSLRHFDALIVLGLRHPQPG
jgi:hypothetical protein